MNCNEEIVLAELTKSSGAIGCMEWDICSEYCRRIISLYPKDAAEVLPRTLYNLILFYKSGKNIEDEVGRMIDYLTVDAPLDTEFIELYFGSEEIVESLKVDEYLKKAKLDQWETLTNLQCGAIANWLRCVRNWEGLLSMDKKNIDIGVVYWSGRNVKS